MTPKRVVIERPGAVTAEVHHVLPDGALVVTTEPTALVVYLGPTVRPLADREESS